jgi:hypothetical protein
MNARKESCPTKTALIAAWQEATETYSKTVAELSRNIGVISKSEYERLSRAAETARTRALKAKTALDTHTAAHGCDGHGEAVA